MSDNYANLTYEEYELFSPTYAPTNLTGTSTSQLWSHKIGNLIRIFGVITGYSFTTPGNQANLFISGMPYTPSAGAGSVTGNAAFSGTDPSQRDIGFMDYSAGDQLALGVASSIPTALTIRVTAFYLTEDAI